VARKKQETEYILMETVDSKINILKKGGEINDIKRKKGVRENRDW